LPCERDTRDREREPQPGLGEDLLGATERASHLTEQARSEQIDRVAPFQRYNRDMDEPYERCPDRGQEELLHDRVDVVLETRVQAGVDIRVERVVRQRHGCHRDTGYLTVLPRQG
jgi:hypothetical protein